MKKKTNILIGAVGVFLTLAGCFVSFAAAPSLFADRYGISNEVFVRFAEFTFMCGAVGALAIGVNALSQRSKPVQLRRADRPKSGISFYESRSAHASELVLFRKILADEFGENEVAPLDVFMKWHLKNSAIFQLVFQRNPSKGRCKIVGVFKAIPIRDALIPQIELEAFTGVNIPEEFICEPGEVPAGFWIGDLVSVNKSKNQFVMGELRHFLLSNIQSGMRIYARGLTPIGLEYLTDFHFLTVINFGAPEMGKTCTIYPEDLDELLNGLRDGTLFRARRGRTSSPHTVKSEMKSTSVEEILAVVAVGINYDGRRQAAHLQFS
jgi:hypothetical protein